MPSAPAPIDAARAPQDRPAALLALLRELVAETRKGERVEVSLDSRLDRDLGLDSLARVEIGLRIERAFGARVPDEALAGAETPRDLLAALDGGEAARATRHAPAEAARLEEVAGAPDAARTLLEMLDWHVERHPDRLHVTFLASDEQTQTLSYGALAERARRAAAGLAAAGLRPGEVCAIMLPTSLEFFAVYCGILMAGGVPVPIYPPFRMSQIEDHLRRQAGILANCEARILVTVPEAKLVARLLRGEVPTLKRVATPEELEEGDGGFAPRPASPDDIAFIQYTSGSTGRPKGVVLTHANLLANIRAMGRAAQATSRDVFVSWLPLYHDMGLIGAWLATSYFAVHLVLMSPVAFLARPSRWLWAIHRHRATISAAPNFAYEIVASRLAEHEIEGVDLASLRWAFNGAEAVNADTMERFAARLAPHGLDRRALAPVYGLAEVALDVTFPPPLRGVLVDHVDRETLMHVHRAVPAPPGSPGTQKIVACGRVLPGYELRIADAHGRALPERVEGRIEFRGPSATRGYYRNPEATAELFDGDWVVSGDLGYVAEGELYVTGRAKDMIIRGGHNIYPHELEEAVGALEGIRRGCVAVFGTRADGEAGERLVVLAETREPDRARRDALRAEINRLAVELVGGPADEVVLAPPHSVLKTSSGKLRRAATRGRYERGRGGARGRAVWWQIVRLAARSLWARARHAAGEAAGALYGAWSWLVFGAATLAGFAGSFVIPGLAARQAAARALARLVAAGTGLRIAVEGVAHLPHARAYVLVANHASYVDAIVLMAALPARVVFVAKSELRQNRFMRRVLEAVGTRFVERFDAARGIEDSRALTEVAGAGESLAFFPEGTFVREPGLLGFRMGAFVLAAQQRLPVVPVALAGTRKALPADAWRLRRTDVRVTVGAPIAPTGGDWAAAVRLRDAARAHILAHCGEPDAADRPLPHMQRPAG
ncbi:MAG: AMP-binding protein [Burkholderiales bacterium]|nr:AMP-binding protein [Burkholderiales bacterium]